MATFSNNGESSNESLNKSCEISSLNSQEKNETADPKYMQAMRTIIKCEDAITQYLKVIKALESSKILVPASALANLEDSLISLAESDVCSGSSLYLLFRFPAGDTC